MRPVEDFTISGVPVFLAEGVRLDAGQVAVMVQFRVGQHDEQFVTSGMNSLVSNLIHASLPVEIRDEYEHWSDPLFTTFGFTAEVGKLGMYLHALQQAIVEPRWDELDQQKDLLWLLDSSHDGDVGEALFALRFGAVGPGVSGQAMALKHVSQGTAESWLRSYFNSSNVVLSMTEAPLGEVAFQLPAGSAHAQLEIAPQFTGRRYSAAVEPNGVAFSVSVLQGPAVEFTFSLLVDLMRRRLTVLERLTPSISFEIRQVDSEFVVLHGSFPVAAENATRAIDAVEATFTDLADGHLGVDVFEAERVRVMRALRASSDGLHSSSSKGRTYLFHGVSAVEERMQQVDVITGEDVFAVARSCQQSLLVLNSELNEDNCGTLQLHVSERVETVVGVVSRQTPPQKYTNKRSQIVFGPEGITYRSRGNEEVTVHFVNCVAVVDDGVSFTLLDHSWRTIQIFPDAWEKGGEILAVVRNNVDESCFVRVPPDASAVELHDVLQQKRKNFSGWRGVIASIVYLCIATMFGLALISSLSSDSDKRLSGFGVVLIMGLVVAVGVYGDRLSRRLGRGRNLKELSDAIWWGLALACVAGIPNSIFVLAVVDQVASHGVDGWGVFMCVLLAMIPISCFVGWKHRSGRTGRALFVHLARAMVVATCLQLICGVIALLIGAAFFSL